jgi:spermidine synthase
LPAARRSFAAWAVVIAAVLALLPGQDRFWLRFHGEVPGRSLVEEDATGVVALTPGRHDTWAMWVSGKHFSSLPYGGTHTLLGALPSMMHARPERIALIGLGSGDTAWASGSRSTVTREIRVFEISAPQKAILDRLRTQRLAPRALEQFLADPRVSLRVADGRNAIEQSNELYDIIEMDPLRPSNAYSGNLYSREFFALCARKLRAGGFMCTWAPSPRVRATFRSVFPYVVDFQNSTILVGSRDPFPLEVAAWQARLLAPGVSGYFGAQRTAEVRAALATAQLVPFTGAAAGEINIDLFPRDEFNTQE